METTLDRNPNAFRPKIVHEKCVSLCGTTRTMTQSALLTLCLRVGCLFLVACSKNVLVAESSKSGPGEPRCENVMCIHIATRLTTLFPTLQLPTQLGIIRDVIARNRGV